MYTLFQSISITLPQTAYLKLIDIWLIFSLILPLVIFIVHMAWEIERVKDERKVEMEGRQTAWKKMKQDRSNKSKFAVQMLLPLITILFTIGYWIYAFQIYNSDSK
jgi:hypothetical protein